ncbi:helix-turn-helix transcriptional regulator [Ulvibacter antarcticus]|uniref:Helix-turn-helix protein n=1 Tax=Ulvibacter antarcticus TaxID=442714 RepID=A0A3L9Z0D8_9FLAO|nr:helix-turn-helix transcriptional regulator [Ulvibacter antarcticus]RMA66431.1 helix-turn-helix protein [Ulvibacter antarcticus]
MDLDIYSSLIIAGVIQGLFLSLFILLINKHKTRAAFYLGLLLLCLSVSNLQDFLWEAAIITKDTHNLIYLPFSFLEPPFLYFFVVIFLYPEHSIRGVEKLLYIPFLIVILGALSYKLGILFFPTDHIFNQSMDSFMFNVDGYGDVVNIVMALLVIIVSLVELRRYEQKHKLFDRGRIKMQILWFKILLIILFITTLFWIYFTANYILQTEVSYLIMLMVTSALIYLLGYIGIHKIGIHEERRNIRAFSSAAKAYSIVEKKGKNEHVIALESFLATDKNYLNPNITLQSVADELKISKGHLSRIINSDLNISFSDYINSLRVEEAKEYLKNPDFEKYTMVAIGLEAGFSSKSTFNNTFKKLTGYTPSQFKSLPTN